MSQPFGRLMKTVASVQGHNRKRAVVISYRRLAISICDMDNSLAIYLHDHLAGAALAVDLLEAMRDKHGNDSLGAFAGGILTEVESDRATLKNLADRIGAGSDKVKELSAWLSEKVSRIKLNREAHSLGTFEALEFLALGILGKLALWDALKTLQPLDARLQGMNFEHLAGRARTQHDQVEERRLAEAKVVLAPR
jgi:hypothetical protein